MSGPEPASWFKSIVNSCFTLLLAAFALWFAVGIVKSIWPALVTVAAVAVIGWLLVLGIRLWRANRW